ncbi:zinc finger CCCH domain-containing protein 23-like [Silene latifolia]|uniref:zinc finger CCCH domain-containing protein 23-like n=1 Tax=Silene latifolia TaxID=37657 RepID=UPI003D7737FF
MMMIQRQQHQHQQQHPTVEIPPWDPPYDDPTSNIFSPQTTALFSAFHRYLPSSDPEFLDDSFSDTDSLTGGDSFSCDNFRMYDFKVRRCGRGRSHDWTECPFAHPGEKARRRDPRKYHYSGTACPDFRRGCCRKGDACEYAHGVFECWLHPARYRTQPCKDGPACLRRVCFFAHTPDQLRILPSLQPESPPSRLCFDSMRGLGVSPSSILDRPDSPPDSMGELVNSVRGLQIGNMSGYGSPRSPTGFMGGLMSPVTRTPTRYGLGLFDPWESGLEEEMPMERVESGKNVRARIYAKLSQENSLDTDRVDSGPDFGWVSELVK